MEKFEGKELSVKQSTADADWLIVSTAMEASHTQNIIVFVIVMMVAQATSLAICFVGGTQCRFTLSMTFKNLVLASKNI